MSFVHPVTGERSLALLVVTEPLAAGAQLTRRTTVTLPENAPTGSLRLVVHADVRDAVVEQDEANNRREATAPTTVPRVLTLRLALSEIREDAQPLTFTGTVVRSGERDAALTITLDNSAPGEIQAPASVDIPAGRSDVTFTLRVLRDDRGDGPQGARLTAAAPGYSSAQAGVRVLDVDVPRLTLQFARSSIGEHERVNLSVTRELVNDQPLAVAFETSTPDQLVAEGLSPATTATVTRNTATNTPLTVHLSSSDETEATVPPGVIIPAGAAAATFPIATVQDQTVDGDQTVVLRATAEGYSPGEDSLVVTDRDLPDLVVGHARRRSSSRRTPCSTTPTAWSTRGWRRPAPTGSRACTSRPTTVVGDDQLLRQYSFTGTLPVNQRFEQTIAAQAPLKTGNYWVIVVTDVADQVREGREDNNARVSAVPVSVRAAYGVTVATDLEQALAGTPVEFYGVARNPLGHPMSSVLVNIHIRLRDSTRVISALTRADGTFRTTWQPLPNEAGVYEVGAVHPGVDTAEVQDRFTLIGMRADPAQTTFRVLEEGSTTGRVRLLNLSPVPLTGLRVEVLEKPAHLTVVTTLGATTLPGVAEVPLNYTVHAADASLPGGLVRLRVSSREGAAVEIAWGVTVEALRPKLVARPATLQAGVLRGKSRTLEFTVANKGGRESGPLYVGLPPVPWMTLASVNPLPSLPSGASHVVTLHLAPPADLPLGIYHGNLVLAGDRALLCVPYDFRALSEGRGGMLITVVDEFTYYAEGAPKVAGATVTFRDPFTHQGGGAGGHGVRRHVPGRGPDGGLLQPRGWRSQTHHHELLGVHRAGRHRRTNRLHLPRNGPLHVEGRAG